MFDTLLLIGRPCWEVEIAWQERHLKSETERLKSLHQQIEAPAKKSSKLLNPWSNFNNYTCAIPKKKK